MIKLTCICSGNTEGRLAFVPSLYPKLFIRHFLSSSVNRYAYLFVSNVIAEFVGLIDYIMSFLICEHKTGWQWKSNIQENSKWNWHVIKKNVLSFLLCSIIDLFCWCSFRGNYTYFVLYKIVIFVSIFLLKFKGEKERNLRHFYDCREGKLRGPISSKLFQEIQNVSCHCNTYNSAINRLYLSASFQITYLQSPCQMLRYQLFIKA